MFLFPVSVVGLSSGATVKPSVPEVKAWCNCEKWRSGNKLLTCKFKQDIHEERLNVRAYCGGELFQL
jgi:hypothetical protein